MGGAGRRVGRPARRASSLNVCFCGAEGAIHPYAQQLADRIDHGQAIISGPFPA